MSIECWTVAFVGKGDTTYSNAAELLDLWFPKDGEIQAILPERIPRTHKGLRTVHDLLEHEFDIPVETRETPDDILESLILAKQQGEHVYLVVLGIEDDMSQSLAEKALDAGLRVKDLCAALDDVEFEEQPKPEATPEPDPNNPPPRKRGRPRKDETVKAEVAGPATLVSHPGTHIVNPETLNYVSPVTVTAAESLHRAIRNIVMEELNRMFPGVHPSTNTPAEQPAPEPPQEEAQQPCIQAYVNADGEYRKRTGRTRIRDGETEVELTEDQAKQAGLL